MKTIAILLALAPATVLAAYAEHPTPRVELTGAQRTSLASWAQSVWPGLVPANTRKIYCKRWTQTIDEQPTVGVHCYALELVTLTAAEYTAAEVAGNIRKPPAAEDIAADGSSASNVLLRRGPQFLYGAPAVGLAQAASAVFGVAPANLSRLDFWRAVETDPETQEQSVVYYGQASARIDVTDTDRLLCLRNGTCAGLSR